MNHRLSLILSFLLLGGSAGFALDLGGLSKALNKAKEVTDTAKDASKVVKGGVGIGPEEEKVIGDSVALEIVGQYGGVVRDEDTLQRVNLVGRALARYSDRPDLDWRFGVLDSDSVNAFSAPDGYVFITRALYALADDDDLLAAILSHEIAHITEKHALKIVGRDVCSRAGKASSANTAAITARPPPRHNRSMLNSSSSTSGWARLSKPWSLPALMRKPNTPPTKPAGGWRP